MDDRLYRFITIFLIDLIPLFLLAIFALIAWRYQKQLTELKESEEGQGQNPGLMESLKQRFIAFSILQWVTFYYLAGRLILRELPIAIGNDLSEMDWKYWLFVEGLRYFIVFFIIFLTVLKIVSLYCGYTLAEMFVKLAAEKERDKQAAEAKARVDE